MKKIKITELLIFIVSAELIGAFSGIIAGNTFSFYNELIRPPFSPPGWIFPIVWGILYALMGISAYMVYSSDVTQREKQNAMTVYSVQLAVNFIWSIVFFRFELIAPSAAVILLLLILVFCMVAVFFRICRVSAYLNLPYLLWTAFAAYLNIGVWVLN